MQQTDSNRINVFILKTIDNLCEVVEDQRLKYLALIVYSPGDLLAQVPRDKGRGFDVAVVEQGGTIAACNLKNVSKPLA